MRRCALMVVLILACVLAKAQKRDSIAKIDTGGMKGRTDSAGLRKVDSLKQVTVVGKRPLIEQKVDRTVLNVDAAVTNAGATVLEVLSRAPGVVVDKDGNISLKGKQGVLVMLDGKPTYLAGTDLANLLESMNANQLDQIEIMTNPPARYDAAGNAGIINLRTKKNRTRGFNGSLSLGYGQGKYWKTNNSLNLNYRAEKYNLFLTYSSNVNHGYTDLHIIRDYLLPDGKTIGSIFDGPTYITRKITNNPLKLGMDYYLTKRTTLGVVATGFISTRNADGTNAGFLQNAQGHTDSSSYTSTIDNKRTVNGTVNLNLRHSFDSTHELTADLDYIQYHNTNPQRYANTAYDAGGSLTDSELLRGNLPSEIRIWSGKADYSQILRKGVKLEAGWKSSLVKTDNVADYFNFIGGIWTPDYEKTNHFLYKENINAGYVNLNVEVGKWTVQGGGRYENTSYNGHQLGNPQKADSSFTRRYNNFFPTLFASWQVDGRNQLTLSGGRRIDRPAYQSLNPFFFFINKYTFQVGNPFLVPQYTTNVQLSHVFKGMLTTTLSYSKTDASFTQTFRTIGDTTIITENNLGRQQNAGVSMSAQLTVTDWWSVSLSANGSYKKVDGYADGAAIRTTGVNAQFNANNQFRWKGGWSAELSGYYNTKDIDGQFTTYSLGQVSTGVTKQVLGGKGTVRVNVQDVFFTEYQKWQILYQNVREHSIGKRDSRVVNIGFTWRFGKAMKDTGRRSQGGARDEQNRVRI